MSDAPKNEVILAPEEAPKKPRVRSKRPPKAVEDVKSSSENDAPAVPVKPVDQRTLTAQSGRKTRLPRSGTDGGVPLSKVDYELIKTTKNPLAVRDQLMREYFASQKHTDELVQKLCALVFKHH
jgi:hypothetical protein